MFNRGENCYLDFQSVSLSTNRLPISDNIRAAWRRRNGGGYEMVLFLDRRYRRYKRACLPILTSNHCISIRVPISQISQACKR